MKPLFNFLIFTLFIVCVSCNQTSKEKEYQFTMKVWEKGAPESNGITDAEYFKNDSTDVYNISEAELRVFLAEGDNTGNMVLICPGGGYAMQAINKEGWEMARWFNQHGVNAAVLKYRLPNGNREIPLKDAKKAMSIIRNNSKKWGVDKVGVCGYSAGGHLASTLATKYDKETRPDFQILFYPVISLSDSLTHWGSRMNLLGEEKMNEELVKEYSSENNVTKDTPKAIIFLSNDDTVVSPQNSTIYKNKLDDCGVECDIHFYPIGNHGWGTLKGFTYYNEWTRELRLWMETL